MRISGLQKFSLIDYPNQLCAIIFTQGCNFRCSYCHNPELVCPTKFGPTIPTKKIFSFLETRQGKLEAITITGGEPTLQPDLIDFIAKIKKMNFLVKLDSNGSNPQILKNIIKSKLVDYVAMDIKAPPLKYEEITNRAINIKKIKQSINLILKGEIDYEFRTTVVKSQLRIDDFANIGKLIKGARLYALQKFVPSKTVDPNFLKQKTYSDHEFARIKTLMLNYVQKCIIR
jgi:pyruvate formate lyase activating enzyme